MTTATTTTIERAVATIAERERTREEEIRALKREIVRAHIAPNIPDAELAYFAALCQRTGLDPILHQIYAIPRGGKWTFPIGIDGLRAIASATHQLAGIDEPHFQAARGDKNPEAATVNVYRQLDNGYIARFSATARWDEYLPVPPNDMMWKKMPFGQLGKCAEALALRKGFPQQLSGLYSLDEMEQADNPAPPAPPAPATVATITEAPNAPEVRTTLGSLGDLRQRMHNLGATKQHQWNAFLDLHLHTHDYSAIRARPDHLALLDGVITRMERAERTGDLLDASEDDPLPHHDPLDDSVLPRDLVEERE